MGNLNLVPLETEPPREIPEEERLLRDRKERQLKLREAEARDNREREMREQARLKNKQDAMAEIEKHQYTYDDRGVIIMVNKINMKKVRSDVLLEYAVKDEKEDVVDVKKEGRGRVRSGVARKEEKKKEEVVQLSTEEVSISIIVYALDYLLYLNIMNLI